jgi:hypothetical protein
VIKYDEGRSRADYGLHQDQTVDEPGPDGRFTAYILMLDGSGWLAGVSRSSVLRWPAPLNWRPPTVTGHLVDHIEQASIVVAAWSHYGLRGRS